MKGETIFLRNGSINLNVCLKLQKVDTDDIIRRGQCNVTISVFLQLQILFTANRDTVLP